MKSLQASKLLDESGRLIPDVEQDISLYHITPLGCSSVIISCIFAIRDEDKIKVKFQMKECVG